MNRRFSYYAGEITAAHEQNDKRKSDPERSYSNSENGKFRFDISFANAANDLGFMMQLLRMITPFRVKIVMSLPEFGY